MKVIVAGTRLGCSPAILKGAIIASGFQITQLVCGLAPGVDNQGRAWAYKHHIPIIDFPADWDNLGKKAGVYRNREMGDYADALIAIPHRRHSKGTYHMITYMKGLGKPVYVHEIT